MAVSLTTHPLLFFTQVPSTSPSAAPLKTLSSKPLSLRPPFRACSINPIADFTRYQDHNRRCLIRSFAAEGSSPVANDREGDGDDEDESKASETGSARNDLSSLYTAIKAYRNAVLDGDEKIIADIEAFICTVENEKNDLAIKASALSTEIKSGKEKHLRLQADFDNFRKRSDKERDTIRSDAEGEVIKSLLPMVDSFERAKQQIKPETDKEKKMDASYQGIYKQFVEIMRSLHVSAVATVGKPFDPALHEAISREESEEFKEGTVIQEFRRGFMLGGRLLRPAMVRVSAGPGHKKYPTAPTGESFSGADHPITAAARGDER